MAPFLLRYLAMSTALRRAGFSLAELSVILAVIGVLFSLSLPAFLNYYQTAQIRGRPPMSPPM